MSFGRFIGLLKGVREHEVHWLDSTDHLPSTRLQATGPDDESSAVVLTLRGAIAPADVPRLCARVHALVEGSHADLVVCDVAEVMEADCATVDALAGMQLTARRLGSELRLRGASDELHDLLALVGLCDVVGLCAGYASS